MRMQEAGGGDGEAGAEPTEAAKGRERAFFLYWDIRGKLLTPLENNFFL